MIGAMVVKKRVRDSFNVIKGRDLNEFMANWAENAILVYPNNLPVGGEIQGKEAIRKWYEKDWEQFPTMNYKVRNVCVENIFALVGTNVVMVEWAVNGKNRNQKEFNNSGVSIIHIKKGKITLMRTYIFDLDVAKKVWGD